MNFQEKLIEASSDLRARAATLTNTAFDLARERADTAARRVDGLKNSFATLTVAGRALNRVAQRHATRFVKENSAIAVAAGKDFGALARTTIASLSGRKSATKTATKSARKTRVTRKRASSKNA
jgi:hypothetical protein